MPPIRVYGHGTRRIIAIHGWFNDHAAFDGMLAGFDPDRFSIALPDLRGYGSRRSSPGPFDMATAAADMLEMADRLAWQTFSVIGHSMGGKAALALAVAAPERLERIIGITPVWAGRAPFDPATLEFFRSAAGDVATRHAILDTTTGERLPTDWLRKNAERSIEISDRGAFAAYLESWAGDDFAVDASGIDRPVLVIVGAHDRGVPEEVVRATWLAALGHAELAVLPDTGHYPMDESPLALAARIIAFIEPERPR